MAKALCKRFKLGKVVVSMLLWENVGKFEADNLMQARVLLHAADGTPILILTVNATPFAYDVQTADGFVLVHDNAGSLVANQVHAQAAARELVSKLLTLV